MLAHTHTHTLTPSLTLIAPLSFTFLDTPRPFPPAPLTDIEAVMPEADVWPISNDWDWHCGNQAGLFGNLRFFTPPQQVTHLSAPAVLSACVLWGSWRESQVCGWRGVRHRCVARVWVGRGPTRVSLLVQVCCAFGQWDGCSSSACAFATCNPPFLFPLLFCRRFFR